MTDPETHKQASSESKLDRIVSRFTISMTMFLLIGLSICYTVLPDACAAVTVYPSWCWFVGGLCLALILFRAKRQRMALASIGLWAVFLVAFADTPLSLWMGIWNGSPPARQILGTDQASLRIISLNSHGSLKAVKALKEQQADLILISETPPAALLRDVSNQLFGTSTGLLAGIDSSILSRHPIQPLAATSNYTIGKITLKAGQEMIVVSLRLTPPPFRSDLWNPACWRAYHDQRILQRDELKQLRLRLEELPPDLPLIVGGDFNANPRDPIFHELPAKLCDAFVSAGVGWGNTITNEAPFLRIDQIWVDHHFQPVRVIATRAENTDHRAVVADLLVEPKPN